MTRSIFDPTGGETEHSGTRFIGPSADNNSHMPTDITDGKVSDEEVAEQETTAQPLEEDPISKPEAAMEKQIDKSQSIRPPV